MLAGLGGGRDANDLARAALKDQEITDADVVAWDSDGVGTHGWSAGLIRLSAGVLGAVGCVR